MMSQQLIIAIGREFGSGGHDIARQLAKKFDLPVYDRNLLAEVARARGMDARKLEQYDELPHNKLMFRTVNGFNSSPEANVAEMQFSFLREKAGNGESFVVVGRCGDEILKGAPGLMTFFVMADREFKRERIMAEGCKTIEEADAMMIRIDRKRKFYYNQFAKQKWGDPRHYDVSINSAKLGIEGTTDLLADYIRARIAKEAAAAEAENN